MEPISAYSPAVQLVALMRFGGLTPRLFELLFQRYGALHEILLAPAESLRSTTGLSGRAAEKLSRAADRLTDAASLIDQWKLRDIHVITRLDREYGEHLGELNDPPPLLYLRGSMPSADRKTVTLVGTQAATVQGIDWTTRLARAFAEAGVQVISSLTAGNDAAAHLGAKSGGGVSYAVIDSGFDTIADLETMPLAIDITRQGGILSEYPPEDKATEASLEASDRLLVGLGQALVVSEMYQSSRRTRDILEFARQIGKLSFFMTDPAYGPLTDQASLEHILGCGAIPLEGINRVRDVIVSLV